MPKMTKTRLQKLLRLFRQRVMFGDKGIRWYIEAHPGGFDFRESLGLSPEDYEAFEDDNDYSLSLLTHSVGKLSGEEVIRLHREISRGGGVREFVDYIHIDLKVLPEIEGVGFRYEDQFGEVKVSPSAFQAWERQRKDIQARLIRDPQQDEVTHVG